MTLNPTVTAFPPKALSSKSRPFVCGYDIVRYALVGVGFMLTKDGPDYVLVYGSPATVRGYVCKCGEKLTFQNGKAICFSCGMNYNKENEQVKESK